MIYWDDYKEYIVVTNITGEDLEYVGVWNEEVYTDKTKISNLDDKDSAWTRYPDGSSTGSAGSSGTLSDGKSATAGNVKSLINDFMTGNYAVSKTWKDSASYKSTYLKNRTVYGNEAFAYKLSDYVFGGLSVKNVSDFADLRVGDVLYYADWHEYLTVTQVRNADFDYVGVFKEKIYEGSMLYTDLNSNDFAYTRYPD